MEQRGWAQCQHMTRSNTSQNPEEQPPHPCLGVALFWKCPFPCRAVWGAAGWSDASHYSNPPAIPSPLSSAKAETAVSPSQRCREVEEHTTLLYDVWGTGA